MVQSDQIKLKVCECGPGPPGGGGFVKEEPYVAKSKVPSK